MYNTYIKFNKDYFNINEFIEGEFHLETSIPIKIDKIILKRYRHTFVSKSNTFQNKIVWYKSLILDNDFKKNNKNIDEIIINQITDSVDYLICKDSELSSGHHIFPFKMLIDLSDDNISDVNKNIDMNLLEYFSYENIININEYRICDLVCLESILSLQNILKPIKSIGIPNLIYEQSEKEKKFRISLSYLCFFNKDIIIHTIFNQSFYFCGDDIIFFIKGPRVLDNVEIKFYRRMQIKDKIKITILKSEKKKGNILNFIFLSENIPTQSGPSFSHRYFIEIKIGIKGSIPVYLNREVFIYKKNYNLYKELNLLNGQRFEKQLLL